MPSSYIVTVPPSVEPITLTEAKQHLRVDFDDEDFTIANIITRARSYAETITSRAFATQTIQQVFTLSRPRGGAVSGPMEEGPNWYAYQQQLGANPFGPAMFYFDLAAPPAQSLTTVEYRITIFDAYAPFTGVYQLDNNYEPARLYFQSPPTANEWRFTFVAGYSASYQITPVLKQPILELIAYFYQYREAAGNPAQFQDIQNKLLAKRVDWI
jgi:hypothetical protein